MGIGATTDLIGMIYIVYMVNYEKGVGSPTLASVIGSELEKVLGSEALLKKLKDIETNGY